MNRKLALRLLNMGRPVPYLKLIRSLYKKFGGRIGMINDPSILRKYIPEHFTPDRARQIQTTIVEKTLMRLELDDHIQYRSFMDGAFDFIPIIMAKALCRDKVYLDVGANVGTTCLPVANCQIETIAIEASPHILGKLYANFSLNPKARLIILGIAVGETDRDVIEIYLPSGGNLGAASLHKGWNNNEKNPKVERQFIFKLDSVAEFYGLENVGLIKLDIEGHEESALMGAQKLLAKSSPAVLFEWRPDVAQRSGLQIHSPLALFPSGYAFFSVKVAARRPTRDGEEMTVEFGTFSDQEAYENVLCVSRNNPDHAAIFAMAERSEPLKQEIGSP